MARSIRRVIVFIVRAGKYIALQCLTVPEAYRRQKQKKSKHRDSDVCPVEFGNGLLTGCFFESCI